MVTMAAFAGLFADDAALKLKEVFDVIFKAKDNRPDKIEEPQLKFLNIIPEKLVKGQDNIIIITGENLDKKKMIVKINDQEVKTAVFTASSIKITYRIQDDQKDATEFRLIITDDKGRALFTAPKPFTV